MLVPGGGLSSLVSCLWARPGAYPCVEHLFVIFGPGNRDMTIAYYFITPKYKKLDRLSIKSFSSMPIIFRYVDIRRL